LLNCLRKVSEKILANRLSHITPKFLDLGQIRGIKNRSAIDAVLGLIYNIQFAEHQKRKITVIFFDIKGAFDFISLKQLLKIIEKLSLLAYIIKWTKCFIENKSITLTFDRDRKDLYYVYINIP